MATFSFRSRAGAANTAVPLMILAFAVVAGFMYWLSIASAAAAPEVAEGTEPAAEETSGALTLDAFSTDVQAHLGQEVTISGLPVVSALGPHSFWTNLTDANETAFLVHLGGGMIASGATAAPGATVEVTGTVMAMSDSILNDWEAAGAFPGPADRIQAEFAETFIEASALSETMAPSS